MAIKNYTSTKSTYESIGEIQACLAAHGATKIMIDYEDGKPMAVTFALVGAQGASCFYLSSPVEGTMRVFQKQKVKGDREQAERTAWRNVRDWVLAQMALVESCDVPVEQVFLPYLANAEGKTLYQAYSEGNLLLGDGSNI